MTRIFNPENPVMQFIGKIGYGIILNIVWFIFCIPIITIGASTTALFHCSEKVVDNQYDGLFSEFLRSFKMNFRQATLAWGILFLTGAALGVDAYVLWHLHSESVFWTILSAVFIIAGAAYFIICMYIFALIAHFDNSLFAMFKNSLMIGMRFLVCTVMMAAIYIGAAWLIIFVYTPLIFLGMGCVAILCSYLLKNILTQCEGSSANEEVTL